jgi:hypothetical protein
MKKLLAILLLIAALPVAAQTTSQEAVKKITATDVMTESLKVGGNTLTIQAASTFTWESGATLSGAAFMRDALGVEIGADVQGYDPDLAVLAGITLSADVVTFISAANNAAMRAALAVPGLATVNDFTDTTEASSVSVAAITTDGGLGVAKDIRGGDDLFITDAISGASANISGSGAFGSLSVSGLIQGKYVIPGHIFGLILSNNASDATNDIDISPGSCTTHVSLLNSGSTLETYLVTGNITKRLDAAWASGTGNGGLDQGSIANATYHVHMITGSSGTDAIFSLSHDSDSEITMSIASPCVVTWGSAGRGHGLVAGSPVKFGGDVPTGVVAGTQYYVIATGLTETQFQFSTSNGGAAVNSSGAPVGAQYGIAGPQMPAGYTYFRRIGSIVRAGAAILPFRQEGDEFTLITPVLDVDTSALTTSRMTLTLASMPTGVKMVAKIRGSVLHATAGTEVTVGPIEETDAAPSETAAPLYTIRTQVNSAIIGLCLPTVLTNANAQVAARSSASSTTLKIATLGWIDTRGRHE